MSSTRTGAHPRTERWSTAPIGTGTGADETMRQLRDIHRRGKLLLFVGAGVSMGLGLPPWQTLIEHMARELDVEATAFADKGSYLTLAEYFRIKYGSIGTLRSWMDREWHPRDVELGKSRIHELIAKGRFPLIYTTNYDRWLEGAFEHHKVAYTKIVSVADTRQASARCHPDHQVPRRSGGRRLHRAG
jgi:hypothetical protein